MTSKKTKKITKKVAKEREYIIPLRKEIGKVPKYRRTPKAVKAIKQFIAKHMRVPDRELNKVKLDKYLNQEMWFRGIENPHTKIKVKAVREGDIVRVSLVDIPDRIKYQLARDEKKKQASEKTKPKKPVKEEKVEERSEEEKLDEKEKEKASAESKEKAAQVEAKQAKHMTSQKQPKSTPQRKSIKK